MQVQVDDVAHAAFLADNLSLIPGQVTSDLVLAFVPKSVENLCGPSPVCLLDQEVGIVTRSQRRMWVVSVRERGALDYQRSNIRVVERREHAHVLQLAAALDCSFSVSDSRDICNEGRRA